jgi:mannose-6-phosphate isomerase-like protein (cupin superfamily)
MELAPSRIEGDTALRAVAIGPQVGSELLELHVVRYDAGRSLPRTPDTVDEILYAAEGRGAIALEQTSVALEPGTAVYVAEGETYEVDNPGPETLLVVTVRVPPTSGERPPVEHRVVRQGDQPLLRASSDRTFHYLVTPEVGVQTATQFLGFIDPGRAAPHGHVYDEVIYVLEGQGALHANGASRPVAAGSSIYLPPLVEHSLENSGDSTMRIVAVFHPAGDPASRAYDAATDD